jgi:xanthine/uracil/vitamin C permease (AzgA family)
MHLATMWLGICGLAFMVMLTSRHVKGAIMYGA